MENSTFQYNYSASRKKEVENIRKKYLPQEENKFEKLERLDKKVENAGCVESLCVGIIGTLIFGIGMCFGLDSLQGPEWMTFVFAFLGIAVMLTAYPLYKIIAGRIRRKFTPEILALSGEIIES